jgi:hypothetical protein
VLPADNTWTMCGKNYLGEALRRKGEYERSLDLLQQSLAGTTLHYTVLHYTIPYYTIHVCVGVPDVCPEPVLANDCFELTNVVCVV